MPDQIVIKDLFLRTIIGINDDERNNRQDVLINLVLETDTRSAGQSDDITDAVNSSTKIKQRLDDGFDESLEVSSKWEFTF